MGETDRVTPKVVLGRAISPIYEGPFSVTLLGTMAALVTLNIGFIARSDDGLVSALAWLLAPLSAAVVTVYVFYWALENDCDSHHLSHIGRWAFTGSVILGMAGQTNDYFRYTNGLLRTTIITTFVAWACGGFVIGSVIGLYSAKRLLQEEQLKQAYERTESLVETLSVLNRVFRHDIRNDMNVIEGYLDLVFEDVDPNPEYVEVIENRIARIVQLSEYVGQTNRIVTEDRPSMERVDVVAAIERIVAETRREHPHAGLRIRGDDDAHVRAHELVVAAFRNLVENAIEHNGDDSPQVTVGVEAAADEVRISVADDGPGIPDAEIEVLEHGGESALRHSNGMGLWLVNWIVTRSEGRVDFEGNDPVGSIVTLTFPVRSE